MDNTDTLRATGGNVPDILDKCQVILKQCSTNVGSSVENDADRLTLLHQLEILEMLLYGLK